MSARHKLNAAALYGILLIAGVAAAFAQSWTVYWVAAIVLTLIALATGSIRIGPQRRR